MRKAIEALLSRVERASSESQISEVIRQSHERLQHRRLSEPSILNDIAMAEMLLGTSIIGRLESSQGSRSTASAEPIDKEVAAAELWLTRCSELGVVSRSRVQRDAGRMLELIETQIGRSADIKSHMETLLRHVEVKRADCLTTFDPPLETPSDRWLQLLDVAILFSRYARRHHDIRFLNAALKLNDWAIFGKAHAIGAAVDARLLLSLAEQEASYKSWTSK